MDHITFSLTDGSKLYLEETDRGPASGPMPAGRLQEIVVSFDAALASVQKMAGALAASIRSSLPESPAEVEIEFGLKGAVEVNGFLVAKAATDAHYKVKLTWKNSLTTVS